mgnify:FL=1|jgi:phage-related protein
MSKMGNWVMEMQEDAEHMSLAKFIRAHGRSQASIWREVNGELYNRPTCENRPSRVAYSKSFEEIPF